MERQGSGLSKICTAYENAANYQAGMEATFRSNRVEFTVKLPNLNFKASGDEALNETLNEALTENKSYCLIYCETIPPLRKRKSLKVPLYPEVLFREQLKN